MSLVRLALCFAELRREPLSYRVLAPTKLNGARYARADSFTRSKGDAAMQDDFDALEARARLSEKLAELELAPYFWTRLEGDPARALALIAYAEKSPSIRSLGSWLLASFDRGLDVRSSSSSPTRAARPSEADRPEGPPPSWTLAHAIARDHHHVAIMQEVRRRYGMDDRPEHVGDTCPHCAIEHAELANRHYLEAKYGEQWRRVNEALGELEAFERSLDAVYTWRLTHAERVARGLPEPELEPYGERLDRV